MISLPAMNNILKKGIARLLSELTHFIHAKLHPKKYHLSGQRGVSDLHRNAGCFMMLFLRASLPKFTVRWCNSRSDEKLLQVHHTIAFIQGNGYVDTEPKTESSERTILVPQSLWMPSNNTARLWRLVLGREYNLYIVSKQQWRCIFAVKMRPIFFKPVHWHKQ